LLAQEQYTDCYQSQQHHQNLPPQLTQEIVPGK
jgi:hypothetical protein